MRHSLYNSLAAPSAALLLTFGFLFLDQSTANAFVPQAATAAPEQTKAAAEVKPTPVANQEVINSLQQVTFDIKYLSSDEMAGRQPGTPGIKLAEDYILAEYKKAGLKPLENGTYMQEFEVAKKPVLKTEATELVLSGPNGAEVKLKLDENYRQLMSRNGFDLHADLVFVGYGISAEDLNFDEYAGVDVKDKIVVVIRREPQAADPNSVFDGENTSPHASGRAKATAARKAGAAGVLLVNDGLSAADDARDELVDSERFGTNALPFAQVKRSVINELLEASPLTDPQGTKLKSLAAIEESIDSNLEPISQPIVGWQAKFKADFEVVGIKTSNIIGIIEGEGPNADETVIIGAHYDHLGNGAYGSRAEGRREIHNGADDNATGTAAVIEIARRINQRDQKPGRRLVFICFSAEEMGLLGAIHYVDNPIYPLEKTAAMVNFDMIGWLRDDKLTLYGWNSSAQLDPVFEAANKGIGLDLQKPTAGFGGSDHLPFNSRSVANVFIHTGINAVYHTPEDDFEAINCEGALRVIDYSEKVVEGLAAMEKMPTFGTPAPFRLGVMLNDQNEVTVEGVTSNEVLIEGVTSKSVAEKAGLLKGDVILEINGEKVSKRREVTLAVRREAGKTIKMKLKRGDGEVVLNIDLKQDENDSGPADSGE